MEKDNIYSLDFGSSFTALLTDLTMLLPVFSGLRPFPAVSDGLTGLLTVGPDEKEPEEDLVENGVFYQDLPTGHPRFLCLQKLQRRPVGRCWYGTPSRACSRHMYQSSRSVRCRTSEDDEMARRTWQLKRDVERGRLRSKVSRTGSCAP